MKKILAFAIILVLALTSLNVLLSPQAKAQTNQAKILSYSWYIAPSTTTSAEYINDPIAIGEVQNTGSTIIGQIWVVGQALDSNGTALATTEARTMVANLAPGQKAPFYLDFSPEVSVTQDQSWVSNVSSINVSIGSVVDATNTTAQYAGLTTPTINGVISGGVYTVSGIIQDTGVQSVSDIAVVTTFYSSNGTVIAVSLTDLGAPLAPGASIPFTATPWDDRGTLSSEIGSYAVLIQSIPVTPTPTPVQTISPTTNPTSSTSGSPTPTQNSGTMGSVATYGIVIAVVVIIVLIVGFMLLRRRGSSQHVEAQTFPPPPPPPPA